MSVTTVLMLFAALLLALLSPTLAAGLGYAVHRRPALAVPVTVVIGAAGLLSVVVFGIVQAAAP
ncbi:hypothetical protein [Streptomyces sennicomposti]